MVNFFYLEETGDRKVQSNAFISNPILCNFNEDIRERHLTSIYINISEQDAFQNFVNLGNVKSKGVVTVSKDECNGINLEVFSSPHLGENHGDICFGNLSDNQRRAKRKLLADIVNYNPGRIWTI